jgi:hypothetical protein
LEGEFWCSTTIVFSPGLSGGQVKNLSLQKNMGITGPGFGKFCSWIFYFDCSFQYLPFTGRYGSGSDETQPVKQHSQGGALWMELLTGPAAVHYRLLVAK